jgi:hypothetical protein
MRGSADPIRDYVGRRCGLMLKAPWRQLLQSVLVRIAIDAFDDIRHWC